MFYKEFKTRKVFDVDLTRGKRKIVKMTNIPFPMILNENIIQIKDERDIDKSPDQHDNILKITKNQIKK